MSHLQLQELIDFSDKDLPIEYIKRGSEEIEKINKAFLSGFLKLNFNSNLNILLIGLPKVKEQIKSNIITTLKKYLKKNNYIQFVILNLIILVKLSYHQKMKIKHNKQQKRLLIKILMQNQIVSFSQKQINHINQIAEYTPFKLKSRQNFIQFQEQLSLSYKKKLSFHQNGQIRQKKNQKIMSMKRNCYHMLDYNDHPQINIQFYLLKINSYFMECKNLNYCIHLNKKELKKYYSVQITIYDKF